MQLIVDSDADFKEMMYIVATMIAVYTNKHMFFNLRNMPDVEQQAEIESLKSIMADMIEELG